MFTALITLISLLLAAGCDNVPEPRVEPIETAAATEPVVLEDPPAPESAPPPDDPGLSPESTQGTITDDMLLTYMQLVPRVRAIQLDLRGELALATTDAEAERAMEDAVERLRETFRGSMLTADEFAAIDLRVKQDMELQSRIDAILEDAEG